MAVVKPEYVVSDSISMGYGTQTVKHTEIKKRKMKDQKYGPQTAEIEALIDRIRTLTPSQSEALRLAWVARTVMPDASWNRALDASCTTALDAARDAAWRDARIAAGTEDWNAARNAILALVVRDQIAHEQFDTLYGAWKSVMEEDES